MKKQIGIWIDRRQAIVVSLTDSKETIKTLVSEFEKHVPTTGGGRAPKPYGAQEIVAGDRVERRIEHHLDRYYDEVSVFMLGKGVMFEQSGSPDFDVMGQVSRFEGEFFV